MQAYPASRRESWSGMDDVTQQSVRGEVADAVGGEVAGFEALYRRNVGRVHAICRRISGDPGRAEGEPAAERSAGEEASDGAAGESPGEGIDLSEPAGEPAQSAPSAPISPSATASPTRATPACAGLGASPGKKARC